MIQLTKDMLQELPDNAKLCNIRAVYTKDGRDMPWARHTGVVTKDDLEHIKEECTQGKPGLRWFGRIVFDSQM